MLAAIEVEQVGQAWHSSPLLIASAAIFAAIVAAVVARLNHGSQLKHDRNLHGQQLRHDREQRDIAYARERIGRAVETVADSVAAVSAVTTSAWGASEAREYLEKARALSDKHLQTYERDADGVLRDTRSDEEKAMVSEGLLQAEMEVQKEEIDATRELAAALAKVREARATASAKMSDLLADNVRLRITIGKGTEIVDCQNALQEAFKGWLDEIRPDEDGQYRMTGDPAEEVFPVGERMLKLVDACQRWSASNPAD